VTECVGCHEAKPLTDFWRKGATGLCKACARRDAGRRYYERNRQKVIDRAGEWNRANPEKLASARANWRERARDEIRAKARVASKTDEYRAKRREYMRGWRAANRDKVAEYSARSWLRRRGGYDIRHPGIIGWATVLRHDPCAYCGGPSGEIDHIDPVTAGGDGNPDNLTAACRSCNASKYNKPLLRFLLDRVAER
jgi:5-methylcytosine-specific restriction endonuclease McrA